MRIKIGMLGSMISSWCCASHASSFSCFGDLFDDFHVYSYRLGAWFPDWYDDSVDDG